MPNGTYKPYPRYKDSGVEWLGEVPEGWEVVPFKWCCNVASGQVDPKDNSFSDKILVAPNHIESNTGRLLFKETVEEQGAISGKYLFSRDSILYSKIRPELCKSIFVDFDGLCSADMYTIKPLLQNMYSKFVFFITLSDHFTRFAVLASERVAMPKVNREALSTFPLAFPPSPSKPPSPPFWTARRRGWMPWWPGSAGSLSCCRKSAPRSSATP